MTTVTKSGIAWSGEVAHWVECFVYVKPWVQDLTALTLCEVLVTVTPSLPGEQGQLNEWFKAILD